jgi:hypothetical protein
MKTDRDIENDIRQQRESYRRVLNTSGEPLTRGISKVVYVPPTPKIRLIFADGKEKQYAQLPANESNSDWDWKVIAGFINRMVK